MSNIHEYRKLVCRIDETDCLSKRQKFGKFKLMKLEKELTRKTIKNLNIPNALALITISQSELEPTRVHGLRKSQ